jgi:WD40 repeat protein
LASAGRWNEEIDRFGNGVLIWNARTGEQIHRLIRTNADAGARAIAFSPDSKLLAMGTQRFGEDEPEMPSTGGVSLIHVMSGVEEWLVTVPGWAKPLAFSSDGRSLAVLCGGRSIRFLDVRTGAMKHEIQPDGSQQDVSWDDFALAPQGGLLAIGEVEKQKGSVAVWSTRAPGQSNADASEPIKTFSTEILVSTIACSADGTLVAVANGSPTLILQQDGSSRPDGDWKPAVDVLDAATGERLASLTLTTAEEDAVIAATERVFYLEATAIALSPDGSLVAVGTSIGQIKVFNVQTGELLCSLDDEAAKLVDEETPPNWKTLRRAMGSVASLEFSPDGALLAACGRSFADFAPVFDGMGRLGELATGPGRLQVWEVNTASLKYDLIGHSHANAVAFSPDGSLLASVGQWLTDSEAGAGVILWNSETGTKERTIATEANGGAHFVAFSPNGALLAIHARRFDLDKANDAGTSVISLVHSASGVMEWQRTIANLAQPLGFFEGDHSVLVLNGGRSLQFLDSDNGETLQLISRAAVPHEVGRWNTIAVGKKSEFLAIGGVDDEGKGHVQVWNFD